MAAKKPRHPNAKTFTDASGRVRPVRSKAPARTVRPPKPNPIDAATTAALQGQIKPWRAANVERQTLYERDVADSGAVGQALDAKIAGIQSGLADTNATALGLAAQRGVESQDQMARNQSFLQSVLGNYVTDGGAGLSGAAQAQGVAANADAAGNATSVALGNNSGSSQLAAQRGAMTMQGGERASQLLQARMADHRSIQNEIARIKATAPAVRQALADKQREYWLAGQELKLSRAQQEEQRRQFDANLQLQYGQMNQQDDQFYDGLDAEQAAAAKPKPGSGGRVAKYGVQIPKHLVADVDALYSTVMSPTLEDGSENKAHRWRLAYGKLGELGIGKAQAALLASTWLGDRLRKTGPAGVYKMLKTGDGLGFKASDALARQIFQIAKLDWSKRKGPSMRVNLPQVTQGSGPGGAVTGTDIAGDAITADELQSGAVNL